MRYILHSTFNVQRSTFLCLLIVLAYLFPPLVWAQDVPVNVTNLSIQPNGFSPDGDGANDSTTIAFVLSDTATVSIQVQMEGENAVVVDEQERTAGAHRYVWQPAMGEFSDGVYDVSVIANGARFALGSVTIDTIPPSIDRVRVSRGMFSPNGDGVQDITEISFVISGTSPDPLPPNVRADRLVGTLQFSISDGRFNWADGPYTFPSGTRLMVFPLNPPTASAGLNLHGVYRNVGVTSGLSFGAGSTSARVTVEAYDVINNVTSTGGFTDGDQVQITWLTGNTAVNIYTSLGEFVANLPVNPIYFGDGEYYAQWGPELEFPDGDYTYRITAADNTGHTTQQSGHLIINNTPIALNEFSISATRISPGQQDSVTGQSIFSFELSKDGRITANIYDTEGVLVRTLVDNVAYEVGAHSILWDGKDDSGTVVAASPAPATTYRYFITVFDPLTTDTDQVSGSIVVDNEAPNVPSVSVLTSPRNQTEVTISGVAEPASQVEVRVNGTLVDTGTAHEVTGEFSVAQVELSEGSNLITVKAIDSVGNTGDDSEFSQEVLVDLDFPATSAVVTSTWQNSDVTIKLTPEDASSEIVATYYTTDGSTPSLVSDVGTEIVLTDEGVYTIRYFSMDAAGNIESPKTASQQVRIDKTAPESSVLELRAGGIPVVAADFQSVNSFDVAPIFLLGSATDPVIDDETHGSGVQKMEVVITPEGGEAIRMRVDGLTEWSFAFTPDQLDVDYTIEPYATDAAGNTQVVSTPVVVRLNSSPEAQDSLLVTPVAQGAIRLEWKDIGTTYDVYRKTVPVFTFGEDQPTFAVLTGTSVVDTDTQDGTLYYYWVTSAGATTFGTQDMLAGTGVADHQAPRVENIAAVPSPFTPDGDRIDDETTLYFTLTEDTWATLRIYYLDPVTGNAQFVRSLIEYELLEAGDQLVVWDGHYQEDTGDLSEPVQALLSDVPEELRGKEVIPGSYLFRFEKTGTYDRVGNSLIQPVGGLIEVQESILSLNDISVLPNPFSPDGDQVHDITYINYTISSEADYVAANIFDTTGGQQRLVRSISVDAKRYIFSADAGQWIPVHVNDGIRPGRSDQSYYLAPVDAKNSVSPPFEITNIPEDAQTIEEYETNYQTNNPNWVPVPFSLPWDGKGATQQGAYIFLLTATNRAGQKPFPKTGEIVLESLSVVPNDKSAPVIVTTSPAQNDDVRNQISEVSAVLNDGQGTGIDLAQSTIRLVGSSGTIRGEQSNDGNDTIHWILAEPLDAFGDDDGLYSIVITTADLAGNRTQQPILRQFQYNMRANDVFVPKVDSAHVLVDGPSTEEDSDIVLDSSSITTIDHVGQTTWSIDEFVVTLVDETEGSGISLTNSELLVIDPNGLQLAGGKWPSPDTRSSGSLHFRLSTPLQADGLHDGVYTVAVTPVDLAGNRGNQASFQFNYKTVADTVAPEIQDIVMDLESGKITVSVEDPFPSSGIDFGASSITVAGPVSGLGTLTHSGTRQENGSVAATLEHTLSETLLVEGRYTVTANVADTEGHNSEQNAEFVFDLTPPEVMSSSPVSNSALSEFPTEVSVQLRDRFSALDDVQSSILLISTEGEFLSGTRSFEEGNSTSEGTLRLTGYDLPTVEGLYQIWALPVDQSGNRGDPITIPFRLDASPPEYMSSIPEADSMVTGSVTQIDVFLSDTGSGLDLANATIALTDPNGDTVIGVGSAEYGVRSAEWGVRSAEWGEGSSAFDIPHSTFRSRLSLFPTLPLSINGEYTLRVDVSDLAGNSTMIEQQFTYDNVPPRLVQIQALDVDETSLGVVSDGTLMQGGLRQIRVSANDPDPASGLDLERTLVVLRDVDGQIVPGVLSNTTESSIWKLAADLANPGVYTVSVNLVDKAGNTRQTEADFSFSVGPGGASQLSQVTTSAGDTVINGSLIRSVVTSLQAALSDTSGTGFDFDLSRILLTGPTGSISGSQSDNGVDTLIFTLDAPLAQDGSADGNYTLHLTVADNSGNLAQPFEIHFQYDTLPPQIRDVILDTTPPLLLSEAEDGLIFSQDVSRLSVVLNDVHAGVDTEASSVTLVAPDGSTMETTLSDNGINLLQLDFDGLPMDGTYTLQVLPVDLAGNRPKTERLINFRYDTTPPVIVDLRLKIADLKSQISNLKSQIIDAGAVVTSATSQIRVTLDDGDGSGVDIAASQISVSGPGVSTSDTVQRDDEVGTLTWRFASPLSADGTDDGQYTVSVLPVDLLGNRADASIEQSFTYSVNAPLLLSVTPADGSSFNEPIRQISATLQDRGTSGINFELSGIEVELVEPDAGGAQEFASLSNHNGIDTLILTLSRWFATDGTDDGLYEARITAVSNAMAGQEEYPVYLSHFRYDTQPPVIVDLRLKIADLKSQISNLKSQIIDAGVGVDFARSRIELVGPSGAVSGTQSNNGLDRLTLQFTPLTQDGIYEITVTATDLLGNAQTISDSFQIDTTAPGILSTEPMAQTTVDRLSRVSATFSDGTGVGVDLEASTLQLLDPDGAALPGVLSNNGVDRLTFALNTPLATNGDDDGSYTLVTVGTDLRGNVSEETLVSFNYSTTSPRVLQVIPADGTFLNVSLGSVQVTVASGNEGLDLDETQVQVLDPEGSPLSGTLTSNAANLQAVFQFNTPLATDGSADGRYSVQVTVADNVGETATYETSFELDTTAPNLDALALEMGAGTQDVGTQDGAPLPTFGIQDGALTGISAILNDAGVGVDLEKSTLTLTGPDGEVAGVQSHNGKDRVFWRFLPVDTSGIYTIRMLPVDKLGNAFPEAKVVRFQLDGSAPTLASTTPAEGAQIAAQLTEVRATLADAMSAVDLDRSTIRLVGPGGSVSGTQTSEDGELVWKLDTPLANNGTDDGSYVIQVTAVDNLGNTSETLERSFEYVTFVPELVGFEPADGAETRQSLTRVIAELRDRSGAGIDLSRVSLTVTGPGVAPADQQVVIAEAQDSASLAWMFSAPLATDGSDDGRYEITLLPDTSNPTIRYEGSFLYDTTPPVIADLRFEIADLKSQISNLKSQLIDVGSGVDLTASRLRLRGPRADVTADQTNDGVDTLFLSFPPLPDDGSADGIYELIVTPVDRLGNRSVTTESFRLLYDTQTPVVIETTPAANATIVAPIDEVRVVLSDGDGSGTDGTVSEVALIHNGSALKGVQDFAPLSDGSDVVLTFHLDKPLAIDGSADGTYVIRVTPADLAGNIASTPVEIGFLFTTTSPRLVSVIPEAESIMHTGLSRVQVVLQDQSGTGIDLARSQVTLSGPAGAVPGEPDTDGENSVLWRLTTPLRQDGSDDGDYTISVLAADNTGLQVDYTLGFQLDTLPPSVGTWHLAVGDSTQTFAPDNQDIVVRQQLDAVSVTLHDAIAGVDLDATSLSLRGPRGDAQGTLTTPGGTVLRLELAEPLRTDGSDDGIYTLSALPVDKVGNRAPRASSISFHHDTQAPLVTSSFPEDGGTVTVAISSVSATLTDQNGVGLDLANSDIALRGRHGLVSGTQIASGGTTLTLLFSALALDGSDNGSYTIEITTRDLAGNESATLEAATFLYQPTAPELVDTEPARSESVGEALREVSATFRDHSNAGLDLGRSSIRLEGPGGSEIPGAASAAVGAQDAGSGQTQDTASLQFRLTHPLATDGTADGEYHIVTTIYDRRGNRGDYSVPFNVDTTEPRIVGMRVMDTDLVAGTVFREALSQVSAQLADDGVGVDLERTKLTLNGPNGTVPTLQKNNGVDEVLLTFHELPRDGSADGVYLLSTTPTDTLGNTTAAPRQASFLYDTQPPQVVASEPQEGGIISGQRQLTLRVSLADADGSGVDPEGSGLSVLSPDGVLLQGEVTWQNTSDGSVQFLFRGDVPTDDLGRPVQTGEYVMRVVPADRVGNVGTPQDIPFLLDALPSTLVGLGAELTEVPELASVLRGEIEVLYLQFEDTRSGVDPNSVDLTLTDPNGDVVLGRFNVPTFNVQRSTFQYTLAVPLSISGWYTLSIQVSDNAGNQATLVRTFLYDNRAPQIASVIASDANVLVTEGRLIRGNVSSLHVAASDPEPGSGVDAAASRVLLRSAQGEIVPGVLVAEPGELIWRLDRPLQASGVYTLEVNLADRAGNHTAESISFGYSAAPALEPEIAELTPSPNTQLRDSLAEVRVRLKDNSGTGIDLGASQILVTGPGVSDEDQIMRGDIIADFRFEIADLKSQISNTLIWQFAQPLATDGSDDGVYTVQVSGVDNAGNARVFAPASFVYDTRPPEPATVVPEEGKFLNGSLTEVQVALEDEGAGIDLDRSRISLSGPRGAITAAQTHNGLNLLQLHFDPLPMDGSADGVYTIQIDPVDRLGNRPVKPLQSRFNFDTTPPEARLVANLSVALVTDPTGGIRVVLDDAGAGVDLDKSTMSVTGPGVSPFDTLQRIPGTPPTLTWRFAEAFATDGADDGEYRVSVIPVDTLGNRPAEPIQLQFAYSATAPVATSISPADGEMLNEPIAEIRAQVQDRSGTGIDWSRSTLDVLSVAGTVDHVGDALVFRPARPFATNGSDDGTYQIDLEFWDNSGNGAIYRNVFHYDTTPARVVRMSAGEVILGTGTRLSQSPTEIRAVLSDEGVGLDLRSSSISLLGPNGAVPGRATNDGIDTLQWEFQPLATDGSADGIYTVRVQPRDRLKNTPLVPFETSFTFDTQPPFLESSQPGQGDLLSSGLSEVVLNLRDALTLLDPANLEITIRGPAGEIPFVQKIETGGKLSLQVRLDIPDLSDQGEDDGTYRVTLLPVDLLGNRPTQPIQVEFTLNTTTPTVIEFAAVSSTGLSDRLDQIVVTLEEKEGRGLDLAASRLSVTGPGVSPLDSPRFREPNQLIWQFAQPLATDGSDDGLYQVQVLAVDTQGTSANYALTLLHDTRPPVIVDLRFEIVDLKSQISNLKSQLATRNFSMEDSDVVIGEPVNGLSVRLSDNGSGLDLNGSKLLLNGPEGPIQAELSHNGVDTLKLTFASLVVDGEYTLRVDAPDLRGNRPAIPVVWHFYRDALPPTVEDVQLLANAEQQTTDLQPEGQPAVTLPFDLVRARITDAGAGVDPEASQIRLLGPAGILPGSQQVSESTDGVWLIWLLDMQLATDGSDDGIYRVQIDAVDRLGLALLPTVEYRFEFNTLAPELIGWTPSEATRTPFRQISAMLRDRSGLGLDPASVVLKLTGRGASTLDQTQTLATDDGALQVIWQFAQPLATDGSDDGIYEARLTVADLAGTQVTFPDFQLIYDTQPARLVETTPVADALLDATDLGQPFEVTAVLADEGVGVDLSRSRIRLVGPEGVLQGLQSNDGVDTLRLRIDQPLSDGRYQILVKPVDPLGNTTATELATQFTADTTPPEVTTWTADGQPLESGQTRTEPVERMAVTLADNASEVDLSTSTMVFDGPLGRVSGLLERVSPDQLAYRLLEPLANDGSADGDYVVTVSIADLAGNATVDSLQFTYTTTSPQIVSTTPERGSSVRGTLNRVSVTLQDNSGTGLDLANSQLVLSGPQGGLTSTTRTEGQDTLLLELDTPPANDGSADGEYRLSVTAVDNTGVRVSYTVSFLYDNQPPVIVDFRFEIADLKSQISNLKSQLVTRNPQLATSVSAVLSDALSGVDLTGSRIELRGPAGRVPGTQVDDGLRTLKWTFDPLAVDGSADGWYTIQVTPRDRVGNQPPQAITSRFLLDTQPPTVQNMFPRDGATIVNVLDAVSVTLADGGSGVDPTLTSVALIGPNGPVSTTVGTQNLSSSDSTGAQTQNLLSLQLSFSPLALDGSANGSYRIEVTPRDRAGNQGETEIVAEFTYQPTAPRLVSSTPEQDAQLREALREVSAVLADRSGVGMDLQASQLSLQGPQGAVPGTLTDNGEDTLTWILARPFATDGSDDGIYVMQILAVDQRGNRGSYRIPFTFDTSAPTVQTVQVGDREIEGAQGFVSLLNVPFNQVAVRLSNALTGVDLDASQLRLSGPEGSVGAQQKNDGQQTVKLDFATVQTDGEYTLTVLPRDVLGNSLAEPLSYSFLLDTNPPQVTSSIPEDGAVVTGLRLFKIEIQLDDAGGSGVDRTQTTFRLQHPDGQMVAGSVAYQEQADPAAPSTVLFLLDEPLAVTGEDDGVYRLTVAPADLAGNRADPTVIEFTYDTEQPLAPKLEDMAVQPLAFSPNQDGILDTTEISYRTATASNVEVQILVEDVDLGEMPLRSWQFQAQQAGGHHIPWDGLNDAGVAVPDGVYRVRISVTDPTTGRTTRRTSNVQIDTQPPVVSVPTLSSNPFTPDGDGFADTVTLAFDVSSANAEDQVRVRLIAPDGTELIPPPLEPPFAGNGSYRVVWTGDGATEDGDYRTVVQVQDLAGNAREHSGLITLDREAPEVTVQVGEMSHTVSGGGIHAAVGTSEVPIQVINRVPFVLSGHVSDTMGVRSLEVFALGEWNTLELDADSNWSFEFSPIEDGLYDLKFRAMDILGHTRTASLIQILYDTQPPVHQQTRLVSPETEFVLSRVTNGESVRIESFWDGDDYSITADLSDLDSTVQGLVALAPDGLGRYTATHPISAGNRHPDGEREIRLIAIDAAGNAAAEQVVQVLLDNTPPEIRRVTQADATGQEIPQRPVRNGAPVHLLLQADQPGYQVIADFSAIDTQYVFGAEEVIDSGDGSYTIRYLIAPDSPLPDGRYEIPVTIWDSQQSIGANVMLQLDNTPIEIQEIQVLDASGKPVSRDVPVFKNGQTLTLLLTLDALPAGVEADFSAIDSVSGTATVRDLGLQRYKIQYRISEENRTADADDLKAVVKVSDTAGNLSTAEVAVRLDNTPPRFLSGTHTGERTLFRNSDTIGLLVRLDQAGYQLSADFSQVDSSYRPGDEQVRDQGDGSYLIQYTLKANNTLATEKTLMGLVITVTASDGANEATDATLSVGLDNHPPELRVLNPIEGERWYAAQVEVEGTTEAGAGIRVRNGDFDFSLTLEPEVTRFARMVPLEVGLNRIRVTATDGVGNQTNVVRSVRYLPRVLASVGGTVRLPERVDDGIPGNETRITVSRGAISQDALIRIEALTDFPSADGLTPLAVYRFTLMNLEERPVKDALFKQAVEIVLQYPPAELEHLPEDVALGIFRWDGVRWRYVGGAVDRRSGTVSASVDRLSLYGVFVMASELMGGPYATVQPLLTPNGDGVHDAVTFPPDSTRIRIFDVRGRLIREIEGRWSWDGRDGSGQIVLPGLYVYHVELGNEHRTGTLVVAR